MVAFEFETSETEHLALLRITDLSQSVAVIWVRFYFNLRAMSIFTKH